MVHRITSLDRTYRQGDLSVFPQGKDSKDTLYEARNNAETFLRQSFTLGAKYLTVDDASNFPESGLLRIQLANGTGAPEVVYYARKVANQFHMLHRGFAGFRQASWPAGSKVTCPVMAEHHNALKDAIIKIEHKIGLAGTKDPACLMAILETLERKLLAPRPVFRAYPRSGAPPLTVRFQNFSGGHGVRFFWEFGDGETSTERNPAHTYLQEGKYTVRLTMVSSTQAQGIAEKRNYVDVTNDLRAVFFYTNPFSGISMETADQRTRQGTPTEATVFEFVDQSDGPIKERHWFFQDGHDATITNPHSHVITHVYEKPGEYTPSLLVRMDDGRLRRANISEGIIVL